MTHNQFSSGLESANLVVTSDPVHQAWSAIEKQKQINPNAEPTLCNPTVSLTLNFSKYDELNQKKTELTKLSESSLIIITGQSMGGSVATLFTFWLLKEPDLLKTKRPLCITFGSPLVGDEHLRQCVLQFTTLKSCFLHVVSNQDPAGKLLVTQSTSGAYKPIGSFLLCSSSGCACFEDPNLILDQLMTINLQNGENQEWHYGQILEELKHKALYNNTKFIGGNISTSSKHYHTATCNRSSHTATTR
ncbi:hypothetical protein ACLB2K_013760 [Fragaria x ananassa]